MKKYLVILCFYYIPVSAQEHINAKEKAGTETKVDKQKESKSESELMKEEEKTVQDLKHEESNDANKPKPIKRGRTRKTIIKVER